MLEILDSILGVFKFLMIPSFIIGVIGVFYGIYARSKINNIKKEPWEISKILIGQLVVLFALSYGIKWIIDFKSRNTIRNLLSQENIEIKIDRQTIGSKKRLKIITELNKIKSYSPHHSTPEKELEIEISSKEENIKLTLKQDSEIEDEYWVYWNKYSSTSLNEIGRITTEILEE